MSRSRLLYCCSCSHHCLEDTAPYKLIYKGHQMAVLGSKVTWTFPNRSKWSLSSVSVMLGGSLPMKRRVSLLGLAVPLGKACFASQCLPPMLCSCILTCCASVVLLYVTNPKPLDSPVLVLRMMVASYIGGLASQRHAEIPKARPLEVSGGLLWRKTPAFQV